MTTQQKDAETTITTPVRPGATQPKSVTLEALMGGARELIILHAGAQYRLRITSSGKLILTK